VPVDIFGLKAGRQRYALFTTDTGGILDDLMVANRGDHLFLVVNAARKAADLAHLRAHLPDSVAIEPVEDRLLLALQGPAAEDALAAQAPAVRDMRFMDAAILSSAFGDLWVSRSGYAGEDGFEISVPATRGRAFAEALLAQEGVAPVGLGARDSLRLEAGLCLYGADLDETTSPAEAALGWAIQKVRRRGGDREGGFPGAERILRELATGPGRLRVGLQPEGRAPMREGVEVFSPDGAPVGRVTSGGFGPSVNAPIAMGYVALGFAAPGTQLLGEVRGKHLPLTTRDLPFHPTTYKR
jgi:aminomethyltransferase